VVKLHDDEGREVTPGELWRALRAEAPAEVDASGLAAFEAAVQSAETAASRDDVAAVLALEAAFEGLARNVKGVREPTPDPGATK
jgi:hypothetical protein